MGPVCVDSKQATRFNVHLPLVIRLSSNDTRPVHCTCIIPMYLNKVRGASLCCPLYPNYAASKYIFYFPLWSEIQCAKFAYGHPSCFWGIFPHSDHPQILTETLRSVGPPACPKIFKKTYSPRRWFIKLLTSSEKDRKIVNSTKQK